MKSKIAKSSLRKLGLGVSMAALAALAAAGCQTPYHAQDERYVLVATNINLPTGRRRKRV